MYLTVWTIRLGRKLMKVRIIHGGRNKIFAEEKKLFIVDYKDLEQISALK